jgi:hypothetical protein
MEADGYVDKSLRTLKGMARRYFFRLTLGFDISLMDKGLISRMQTNKLITGGIITILILIIVLVVWAKVR